MLKFQLFSSLLILICTKIQLHFATVCSSGPCIATEVIGIIHDQGPGAVIVQVQSLEPRTGAPWIHVLASGQCLET